MLKKPFLFLLIAAFPALSFSADFHWNLNKDDRLELVKTAKINFLINNTLQRIYEERNIIDLTCYDKKEDGSFVKGGFSVFTREHDEKVFRLTDKKLSDFEIHTNGKYSVPDKYLMPNLRHIPMFPDKDIAEGDEWTAPVELYLDNFSVELGLLLSAKYKLKGYADMDGVKTALIEYTFVINKDLSEKKTKHPDLPNKIVGENNGIIYWDTEKNQVTGMNDKYRIIFAFLNRGSVTTYEFRMNIDTESKVYRPVAENDKNKDKEEIKKELPEDSGITVESNDTGIVLRMGEVLFDFDSAKLKSETQETLKRVIDIIKKKYPDREIIVEGHTDSTGTRDYNMKLSENRANNVAEFLKGGVGHDKLSYKGYGPDRPINGNRTETERRQNRRVDITIKLK
ncbi:MAG: OmpA family protein [Spirochaetes bacterium]|nr:OmpA family protein [Spirochaetota bacterium]